VVAALSIAVNSFPLRTYEGLDLWFGGIFPCIAILYISPLQGVLAASISYAVSLSLWGHPFGLIGSVLLSLVGAYANRSGSRKLFYNLLLVLSFLVPLVAFIVLRYGNLTGTDILTFLLKPPVNSILNLSFAILLVESSGARRWLPGAASAKPHPLRSSLLAGFLAVSMTPILLVFLLQGRHFEQNLQREQAAKLHDAAGTISGEVAAHLNRHLDAVLTAASAIEEGKHSDPQTLARIMEAWHRRFPGFLTMIVSDRQGHVIAAHPPLPDAGAPKPVHSVADRPYFLQPKSNGKPFISPVFRGRGFGTDPIVALSAPYRLQSAFAGVVEGSLDLAGLRSSLMGLAAVRHAELIVLDQTKIVVATSGTGLTHLDDLSGTSTLHQIRANANAAQPFHLQMRRSNFLAASVQVPASPWVTCILYPESAIVDTLQRYFAENLLLLSIIMVLSVIAANFLARQVTRPLDGLMHQVRGIRDQPVQFSATTRADQSGPEEVQLLHHDFQQMAGNLQRTYRGLQSSIQERDALNARLTSLLSELEERVRERTAEFESAKLRAEEASRTKSAFLANMSHEVRTPLNGVIGMLSMILDHPLPAGQKERADIALDSAESLLTVLNDVLDLSKIEAGHLSIERVAFRMDQLIETALLPFRTSAESKGLAFQAAVDPKCCRRFFGDPARLRQVLSNLAGNAVKFTSQGGISIIVHDLEIDERSSAVHVQVCDTGIGIPKQAQLRLFSPFQQADSTTTRKFGGTGLGLAICRELIQRMGGVIGFESTEGAGSTFWFRVVLDLAPDTVSEPPSSSRPAAVGLQSGRVLIVEDNPVNQLVAQRLVEKAGYAVTVVDSGLEALHLLSQRPFDAILMDCQMPEMDGYQTTAEIRRLESVRRTPIIAMTAHAMSGDRERCLAAGMDDYITKPVRESELHELLHRWTAVAAS